MLPTKKPLKPGRKTIEQKDYTLMLAEIYGERNTNQKLIDGGKFGAKSNVNKKLGWLSENHFIESKKVYEQRKTTAASGIFFNKRCPARQEDAPKKRYPIKAYSVNFQGILEYIFKTFSLSGQGAHYPQILDFPSLDQFQDSITEDLRDSKAVLDAMKTYLSWAFDKKPQYLKPIRYILENFVLGFALSKKKKGQKVIFESFDVKTRHDLQLFQQFCICYLESKYETPYVEAVRDMLNAV